MGEREEIETRFRANLERIVALMDLYATMVPTGQGRKPIPVADLLRAAVVLLHATLEDLLRSLGEWKLPTAPVASLDKIMMSVLEKSVEKINLAELAEFRGQTVDSVVARSIERHLERSSYNNLVDVMSFLARIGIKPDVPKNLRADLAAMMNRRHWIAHRVDRNQQSGRGHQRVRSISLSIVTDWIKAVEYFGLETRRQV